MQYQTHIKCDDFACGYVNRFYSKEMYARCKDIIKLNLAVPFSFRCCGCGEMVIILKENIIKNQKD